MFAKYVNLCFGEGEPGARPCGHAPTAVMVPEQFLRPLLHLCRQALDLRLKVRRLHYGIHHNPPRTRFRYKHTPKAWPYPSGAIDMDPLPLRYGPLSLFFETNTRYRNCIWMYHMAQASSPPPLVSGLIAFLVACNVSLQPSHRVEKPAGATTSTRTHSARGAVSPV